jgi:hypothetical protein
MRALLTLTGVLLLADPGWAAKIPPDVRAAFEERFFQKRTYLVVVQPGNPNHLDLRRRREPERGLLLGRRQR